MIRVLILITLVIFYGPCSKNRPNPQPFPTPVPTVQPTPEPTKEPTATPTPEVSPTPVASPLPSPSPSPAPLARATPYPTPVFDSASYIPPVTPGKIVAVSGENLAEKIQAAQDDPEVGTVRIEGGGSITKQVTLKKHTVFDSSTYSCDVQGITDYGQFLIADGVHVEGTWRMPKELLDYFKLGRGWDHNDPYLLKVQALTAEQLAGTGTTILEPTYVNETIPAIEVFQALGDSCCSHTDKAANIAVIGFHIKGRQKVYDGGVRSTILFGNCHNCTAQDNYLEDTGSIGITSGGSALEKDNYADRNLFWHNVTSGVAAANLAAINSQNLIVAENYVRRPGHHDPKFGGGVCGFDMETNSPADHSSVTVINNLFDYEDAHVDGSGSAICAQDPYHGENRGPVVVANNVAIGGREDRIHRYMSNGIYLVGLKAPCHVSNNYVFRTGQNAVQAYALDGCVIEDTDMESVGGPELALVSIVTEGVVNSTFRRNNYRERAGLTIGTGAGIWEKCGKNNVYEQNLILGVDRPGLKREPCGN